MFSHKQIPLFAPLTTPEEMRLWDHTATTNFHIPPVLLMENAGRAALAVLREHVSLPLQTTVLVIMGRGNNGGDGAAIARGLQDIGCRVLVCHLGSLERFTGAAKEHIIMAQNVGVTFLPMGQSEELVLPLEWRRPAVIVDAVTGTGLKGDLRERELAAVRIINQNVGHSFILALDIPSGLCGYTGVPRPEAVRADATVTFEAGKPGLFFPEAKAYTGKLAVRPIGMPFSLRGLVPPTWRLIDPRKGSWAKSSPFLHKGRAGRVLVIGGSSSMSGAPLLAALGALRAGSGLVHVACPEGIAAQLRQGWPEIMVHGLGAGGEWTAEAVSRLPDLIHQLAPHAIALGPGMGRGKEAMLAVKTVLEMEKRPSVIVDADALFFFHLPLPQAKAEAGEFLPLSLLRSCDILTPHPGEMAKMLPCSFFSKDEPHDTQVRPPLAACIETLQEDRAGAVRAFTRVCSAAIVLKGPGTLIAQHDEATALAPFATAALAVGGSGDVLAGAVASLVGMGLPPMEGASLAVYLHAKAGEMLEHKAPRGHLAQEIADAIPLVWHDLMG